jgi:hypothetical protein
LAVERQLLESWCDRFTKAWQENDRALIGSLVPDEFTWRTGPFSGVFRDRETLVDHWVATVQAEREHQISYEILWAGEELGIVRFRASFIRYARQEVTDDILLAVRLDADGRCRDFREWCRSGQPWREGAPSGGDVMNRQAFLGWLDRFSRIWETRCQDVEEVRSLFTDPTYWGRPQTPNKMTATTWVMETRTQTGVRTSWEVLCVTDKIGIAVLDASWIEKRTTLVEGQGLFIVRLNEEGRTPDLNEWWTGRSTPLPAYR